MDTNKTNVRVKMNENINVKDVRVRNKNDIDYNKKGLYNHASTNNMGVEPMIVVVNINGRDINFEIDTGTYAVVISEWVYNEYFSDFHILKTNKDLRTYCGQLQVPIGELVDLTAIFNKTKKIVKCFVLPGTGPALIGRRWLKEFGAWPLTIPHLINKLDSDLHDYITKEYEILFDNTPGMYNKSTTKIRIKEDTRPVALKYRML